MSSVSTVLKLPTRVRRLLEQPELVAAAAGGGTFAGTFAGGALTAPVVPLVPTFKDVTDHLIATSGFMHDRDVPPDWERRLREISPKSNECGWLDFVWEPGDPWVPGQRWTLCEMVHEQFVEPVVLRELRGPHPRSEGHMCSVNVPKQFQCLCRRKMESWRSGPCYLVTLTQWKVFQRTGFLAVPFWVIQGTSGGHKREFNELEQQYLRQMELPSEPPRIGDMEYAPFDERVVQQIVRYNRLENMGMQLDEYKRTMASGYEQHKAGLASKLRREWVAHLEEQMREPAELFMRASGELENERRTSIDYDRLDEQATDHYIQTGRVLHPTEMR